MRSLGSHALRRVKSMVLVGSVLAGSVSLVSACDTQPVSPATVTCAHYDDFLLNCTANCAPTWDCERNYERMSLFRQDRLDACSDCLVANLNAGICADCTIASLGVGSCQVFIESLLGIDCWF